MKKIFYFSFLLILISGSVKLTAGTKSTATVTGVDKVITLWLTTENNEHVYCGTINGTADGKSVKFYCIDIHHTLDYSVGYQDGSSTSSKVTYILNNYYPYKSFPYSGTGALTESQEAAAVQLSIWHMTDNLDLTTVNFDNAGDEAVRTRANQINADADANAGTIQPFKTLVINIPVQSFAIGAPVTFHVETYNEIGAPIPGANITLSVDEGSLSAYNVTTDNAGISAPITLTAGPGNQTTITASAKVTIPNGTEYYAIGNKDTKQKLVIATPVVDTKEITANVTWYNTVNLQISKTCGTILVNDGDAVEYIISVKNTGTAFATNVQISDVIPSILTFLSTDGDYNPSTHIWNAGNIGVNETKTLKITTKANFPASSANILDFGIAKDYNQFVLNDINQPSCDTQGKLAVGHDAYLAEYSVGDQLGPNSGDVLIVGRKLTYKSGRVYNGDVAFGSFIDTTHCNLADGRIKMENPIDFAAASLYLNNLSEQISLLGTNGTVAFEYGHLALTGTNPSQNKFLINADDLNKCTNFTIDAPVGSVVIINVKGNNIGWSGGYVLNGVKGENVLINFYEATSLKISMISITGSILAPKADLDFPYGLITGQVIIKNCSGSGQFNYLLFNGKISAAVQITNVAQLVHVDQPTASVIASGISQVSAAISGITDVQNYNTIPDKFALNQNYPNPFNPTTTIEFAIPTSGLYSLRVYNVLGEEVANLVNAQLATGLHKVNFDASRLTSGIYIYRLSGSNVNISKKMILMK